MGEEPAARLNLRVIPACAGKGGAYFMPSPRSAGHPRLRGEGSMPPSRVYTASGSSPPARGRGIPLQQERLGLRVIPACAGKGASVKRYCTGTPGHPRLRGEGGMGSGTGIWFTGSSPPARGRGGRRRRHAGQERVIPACAGKGWTQPYGCWPWAGHPRLRGEGLKTLGYKFGDGGSSPPARGRAFGQGTEPRRGRVIPACAGKG